MLILVVRIVLSSFPKFVTMNESLPVIMVILFGAFAILFALIIKNNKKHYYQKVLEAASGGKSDTDDLQELKRQIGRLMNENELLHERLKSVELSMADLQGLSEAEKEKIAFRMDVELTEEEIVLQKNIDK
jgi:hypothetical protein